MQETQKLSFLSSDMENEIRKEITTIIADSFSELTKKAGTSKEWLSKQESCSYMGISNGTLDRFINEFELKVTVISGVRRFKKSDLDEFYLKHQI